MKTEDKRRARFLSALDFVFQEEGGWANRPPNEDPGGPTKYGITIGALSSYLGRPATLAEVQALTKAQAEAIYLRDYWNVSRCDELPDGLDVCVFDLSVRGGPGRAGYMLQDALANPAVTGRDGVIGPKTVAEVRRQTQTLPALHVLINTFCDLEDRWDDGLSNARYNPGWEPRLDRKREVSIHDAALELPVLEVPKAEERSTPLRDEAIKQSEASPPKPPSSDPVVKDAAKAGGIAAGTVIIREATPEIIHTWLPTLGEVATFITQHKDVVLYVGLAIVAVFVVKLAYNRYVANKNEIQ